MSPDEFRRPIGHGIGACRDWQPLQVPTDVLRERRYRGVPARRLLPHRLENNVVEITAKVTIPHLARRSDLRLAHHTRDLGRIVGAQFVRPGVREQLVQHRAESVHVGRRRHRLAANLLGADVVRRHHRAARAHRVESGQCVTVQQLGDSEIEQLGNAVRGHEDVSRLDVAVHDQVLMRVLHRVAHVAEQTETVVDRQLLLLAPRGNLQAIDKFQDDIRRAVFGRAAIEQPGDIGMLQMRENLSLAPEPRNRGAAVQVELECLDRDLLVELGIVADREVDRTHAAVAKGTHDPIGSDAPARRRHVDAGGSRGGPFDHTGQAAASVGSERRQERTPHLFVVRAVFVDEPAAFRRTKRGGRVIERVEAPELIRIHTGGVALKNDRSHAAPSRTSFSTVLMLTFRTTAISAICNPPKNFNSIARALRASTSASFDSPSSSARRSTDCGSLTAWASSSDINVTPAPRLAARCRRAWSTRI